MIHELMATFFVHIRMGMYVIPLFFASFSLAIVGLVLSFARKSDCVLSMVHWNQALFSALFRQEVKHFVALQKWLFRCAILCILNLTTHRHRNTCISFFIYTQCMAIVKGAARVRLLIINSVSYASISRGCTSTSCCTSHAVPFA